MLKRIQLNIGFIFMATLLLACQNSSTPPKFSETPIDAKDIQTMMAWWVGDYNNDQQISTLRADGVPIWQKDLEGQTLGGFLPVTAHYRKIDMPQIGDNVLYVEEKTFGENGNPYRQRFYTFKHDKDTGLVSVKLWSFKDKKTYLESWKDLNRVKNLKAEDLSPLPDNCDLIVSKTDQGRYYMKMPDCTFGTKIFDYQVNLGPDTYWYRDRIVNAETQIVEMSAGLFGYHTLDKLN